MRDSSEAYTQSLVASLIDLYGRDETLDIVEGWLANGVDIMSNDILLIEAVDAGTCDVAIVNHYYVARELDDDPDLERRRSTGPRRRAPAPTSTSPAPASSRAATTRPTPSSSSSGWPPTGQHDFIGGNHEYPVNPDVEPDDVVAAFGEFTPMQLDARGVRRAQRRRGRPARRGRLQVADR